MGADKIYKIINSKTGEAREFASLVQLQEFLNIKCIQDLTRCIIDGKYKNWQIKVEW